ncbi:hypothetical protein ACT048_20785 [Ectopseudomonas khazarica]|uniref:hypothetical protein n=1 Tax=Ectopseudomonas khazarica TaxID=2502979 RepID=UPI0040342B53
MKEKSMLAAQDAGTTPAMSSIYKTPLAYAVLLLLASYGMLYCAYKYHIPWIGGDDFAQYYNMYLNPLKLDQAQAPFIYRQLSALIAHSIYALGIAYPGKISFNDPGYDQAVFFAAILSNYIALLLTAIVTSMTIRKRHPGSPHAYPLMGGLLCFMAFYAQQGVLTGLTEGWAWFLVAVAFYGYSNQKLWIVVVALALSVIQRETIPILILTLAAVDWLLADSKEQKLNHIKIALIATAFCFIYFVIRSFIFPAPGHEYQLSLNSLINNLISSFPPSKELIFQGVIAQNSYFVFLALLAVNIVVNGRAGIAAALRTSFAVHITVELVALQLLGLATGIGNSIGRIAAIPSLPSTSSSKLSSSRALA